MKKSLAMLLTIVSFSLVSCGESKQLLKMQVSPISPFVLDQDFTEDKKVYKANWISFKFQIKNEHSQKITIAGLRFTVTNNSSKAEKVFNIGVGQILTEEGIKVKEIFPNELLAKSNEEAREIYLDGLPKEENVQNANYSYSVKVEVRGWIGTTTEPVGRLSATYFFNTLQ